MRSTQGRLNSRFNNRISRTASDMKYYVKPRRSVEEPYTEDELVDLIGRLKIGKKTPCRSEDASDQAFRPLNEVVPVVVERIENRRSNEQEKSLRNVVPSDVPQPSVMVTTETAASDLLVEERLGIVTAEVAIGLNVFKDIFTVARDIVGGRSETIQKAFSEAKDTVIEEMKKEALNLEADAIIAADFKYNEISSGRSMLLMVGTGTAVRLASSPPSASSSSHDETTGDTTRADESA